VTGYAAVGCADVVPPQNVWWKRNSDGVNATFGCIGRTSPVQRMTCVGNDWHSDVTTDSIDCPDSPQTGETSIGVAGVWTWASTCTKKWGGPNRKIIGSKNLVFLKPSKKSKVQILGFYFFYLSCNL